MTSVRELGTLMLELFAETEEGEPEKPVVFTDRAKEIIREISGYSHMTGLWRECQRTAEACYSREKTPERIFMAIVCRATDAPTTEARDCILIGHMPHLSRALGLEKGNYV